jgi:hypothetical protein
MLAYLLRVIVAAVVLVTVSETAQRLPRIGALILSLPIVSILAFVFAWSRSHDIAVISRLARETLILVPLGLPFFLPPAFAQRFGLGFWTSLALGVLSAALAIGLYLSFSPDPS